MLDSSIDHRSVAIAVVTFYPKWYQGKLKSIKHTDKVRGDLALEFFALATKMRYQVVCVDGKSSKTFKGELAKIDNLKIVKRKSMRRSPSKRMAIKVASKLDGVQVILLNEPEKISVLQSIDAIVSPIFNNEADIVVPRREDRLFKSTYPRYMYESEIEGNKIFNEALISHGLLSQEMGDLDSLFGPRVLRNDAKTRALFLRRYTFSIGKTSFSNNFFDPEEYSNAQFFPIVMALQKGVRIKSVEIPFSYPKIQKENEQVGAVDSFVEKRNMQRLGILVNLVHFLSYLEKKKSSRVRAAK